LVGVHVWRGNLVLRDMARAGRGELVGINEESSVQVARVQRHHPVVHVLLGALGLVAGGEESASGVWGSASLQSGGLGVVVLAVTVLLRDVLKNDPPESLDVDGSPDLGVVHVGGAEVALGSNPVGGVVGRRSLGGSSVVAVVEGVLLVLGDVLHEVVGALVGHVGVLLQENGVMADLGGDLVLGVLGVDETEGKVGVDGAGRGGLGVTVGWWWGWGVGGRRMRMGSEDDGKG